jgi:NAD-dependent deacetylase
MQISWNREAGPVVALTGAGISAESGIPTFRGKDGYWTVGSTVYHPMELATLAAFERMPQQVWQWYLYRRTVCRRAEPNRAHAALVDLERHAQDDFWLVTQNVDGLHTRAGSSLARTHQIHGNIDYMRCARACRPGFFPIPDEVGEVEAGEPLTDAHQALLVCPSCGGRARPHVLWFDEYYDEELYRFESSLALAERLALLIVIGSTGSTNLPLHMIRIAASNGATIVDINIDDNHFGQVARATGGLALRGPAGELVPELVDALRGAA